jgi:lysophospholipase L1-like esterase
MALSPTAYWRLGEASGATSAADSSGNGHAAPATSVTFGVPGLLSGDADMAASFTADAGRLTAPASADWSFGTGDFTVALWFKGTPSSTNLFMGESSTNGWWCGTVSGKPTLSINGVNKTGGTSVNNNAARHLVFRRTSGACRIFVDGVLETVGQSTDNTATGNSTSALSVGGFDINGFSANGVMDEVAIWKGVALSDGQIAALYAAGAPAVAPTPTIAASDAGFVYSGRWGSESAGTERRTMTAGSTCEFDVIGSATVKLCFDPTVALYLPGIAYWIDGAGPTRAYIDNTGLVTLPWTGTASHVRFLSIIDPEYPTTHDDWTSQRDALRFLGIQADVGATLGTPPSLPPDIEFIGDSITVGNRVYYTGAGDGVAVNAPEMSFGILAAASLGLRPILTGHGGQGITVAASDGTPIANSAFPYSYAGKVYAPVAAPRVVFLYYGTNDSTITTSQYQTLLTTVRTAYPQAWIFAAVPVGITGTRRTNIQAAVAAMADAKILYLDYSGLSVATADGTHPNVVGHVTLGAQVAADLRPVVIGPFAFLIRRGGGMTTLSGGLQG